MCEYRRLRKKAKRLKEEVKVCRKGRKTRKISTIEWYLNY